MRYYTLHGLKTDYHGVDGFVLTCQGSDNVYIHTVFHFIRKRIEMLLGDDRLRLVVFCLISFKAMNLSIIFYT